jgi:hypothetical protein
MAVNEVVLVAGAELTGHRRGSRSEPGSSAGFRILNCASGLGVVVLTRGSCEQVTPRSARSTYTGLEVMEGLPPRSACTVSRHDAVAVIDGFFDDPRLASVLRG